MSEDVSCGRGKDVTPFQKGQIIGLHKANKTSKEIAESTKTGLRTVQRIIKAWKDDGQSSSSREKCGRKKILNERDRRSLKRLVKSNGEKPTGELAAMFSSDSKVISARTMRRELKRLRTSSRVTVRKPLIGEADRKKRLQHVGERKDWTLELSETVPGDT